MIRQLPAPSFLGLVDAPPAVVILPGEMTADGLLRNWQKATVLTLREFAFRLFAYALTPFIYASRSVAGLPRLATLEAAWINILTIAEKRSEQRDPVVGTRSFILGCDYLR
jgi:hypothetical protein